VVRGTRRRVQARVASTRDRANKQLKANKQTNAVEHTIDRIQRQTQKEKDQAMGLQASAQTSVATAHKLTDQAEKLKDLATSMDNTAALDLQVAKQAAVNGRRYAEETLGQEATANKGKSPSQVDSKTLTASETKAKDAAFQAASTMKAKTSAAEELKREAVAYRHQAAQLQIQADLAATRAPHDLELARKELDAADRLEDHVTAMKKALSTANQINKQEAYQSAEHAEREERAKQQAVESLARLIKKRQTLRSEAEELRDQSKEIRDKAKSDKRAVTMQKEEALATLRAARSSEDGGEGRLHEVERRWRITQQQIANLNAEAGP